MREDQKSTPATPLATAYCPLFMFQQSSLKNLARSPVFFSPSLSLPLTTSVHLKNIPPSPLVKFTDDSDNSDIERRFFLQRKLLGDVIVAATVTAVAAPFLTIVDKALVERAAKSKNVLVSAKESIRYMMRHPIQYARSPTFLWMWATYAATYSSVNTLKTITEFQHMKMGKSSNNYAIFLGTTATNSTASLLKDRAYARLHGKGSTSSSPIHFIPKMSYGLWIARDLTVVGSSFILPDYLAPFLECTFGCEKKTSSHIAQIATPMAAQFVAGPLHVLGLDFFNRPTFAKSTWTDQVLNRIRFLRTCYTEVVAARILRVVPGYGIAGIWNNSLRQQWRTRLANLDYKNRVQRLGIRGRRFTLTTVNEAANLSEKITTRV